MRGEWATLGLTIAALPISYPPVIHLCCCNPCISKIAFVQRNWETFSCRESLSTVDIRFEKVDTRVQAFKPSQIWRACQERKGDPSGSCALALLICRIEHLEGVFQMYGLINEFELPRLINHVCVEYIL